MSELSPEQASELIAANAQLVDVRTDEERTAGQIPGSLHIPFDRLQEAGEQLDRETPVVLYCRTGDRSAAAAQALEASGWQAHNLEGGIVAWSEAGKEIQGEVAMAPTLPPR